MLCFVVMKKGSLERHFYFQQISNFSHLNPKVMQQKIFTLSLGVCDETNNTEKKQKELWKMIRMCHVEENLFVILIPSRKAKHQQGEGHRKTKLNN